MRSETTYIADDGTKFTNQVECAAYEEKTSCWFKGIYYCNEPMGTLFPNPTQFASHFKRVETTENLTETLQDALYIYFTSEDVAKKVKAATGCEDLYSAGLFIFHCEMGKFLSVSDWDDLIRKQVSKLENYITDCYNLQRILQTNGIVEVH